MEMFGKFGAKNRSEKRGRERERERERDLTQQKRSRSDPICDLAKPKVLEKGYKSNVKKSDTDFAFYK